MNLIILLNNLCYTIYLDNIYKLGTKYYYQLYTKIEYVKEI